MTAARQPRPPLPHLMLYRRHDRIGKWSCISTESDGYERIGTAYTREEAYAKWERCGGRGKR